MSSIPAPPGSGRRHDQRGFTLIELLAAVAIIATVMVPVTAWALLAMKQQTALQDRNTTATASGLLRSYVTGDVASSASLSAPGTDCAGSAASVMTLGSGPDATTYVVRTMLDLDGSDVPGKNSLWRVECGSGSEVQIVEDIEAASATCETSPPGTACKVVTLVVSRVEDPSHPIKLTVSRRTA